MAAVDYFLKRDGIEGESIQKGHEKELEILSFSWSESNKASRTFGGGLGKVVMDDFNFTMPTNKASPKLFRYCAVGEHTLTCRKAGKIQQEYLKWSFTDLLVSSYRTEGCSDVIPQDFVSLNFTQIRVSYAPQKADGSLDAPWINDYNLKSAK